MFAAAVKSWPEILRHPAMVSYSSQAFNEY